MQGLKLLFQVFFILTFMSVGWGFQRVETEFRGSNSNSVSRIRYQYQNDEPESIWSTQVIFTSVRSKIQDASDEAQVRRDLQWVNSWDLKSNTFVDLGLGGSNTRVNKIRTANADLTLGQRLTEWKNLFGSLTFGSNSIRQEEARTPGGDELQIQQKRIGMSLGFSPLSSLSVQAFYNRYDYSEDVDQVLILLESEVALRAFGTAFADDMTTLLRQDAGLSMRYRWNDTWSGLATLTETEDAPEPNVRGRSWDFRLEHVFNQNWEGSFLFGSTEFRSTSTTPSNKYGYVGLGASYSW